MKNNVLLLGLFCFFAFRVDGALADPFSDDDSGQRSSKKRQGEDLAGSSSEYHDEETARPNRKSGHDLNPSKRLRNEDDTIRGSSSNLGLNSQVQSQVATVDQPDEPHTALQNNVFMKLGLILDYNYVPDGAKMMRGMLYERMFFNPSHYFFCNGSLPSFTAIRAHQGEGIMPWVPSKKLGKLWKMSEFLLSTRAYARNLDDDSYIRFANSFRHLAKHDNPHQKTEYGDIIAEYLLHRFIMQKEAELQEQKDASKETQIKKLLSRAYYCLSRSYSHYLASKVKVVWETLRPESGTMTIENVVGGANLSIDACELLRLRNRCLFNAIAYDSSNKLAWLNLMGDGLCENLTFRLKRMGIDTTEFDVKMPRSVYAYVSFKISQALNHRKTGQADRRMLTALGTFIHDHKFAEKFLSE